MRRCGVECRSATEAATGSARPMSDRVRRTAARGARHASTQEALLFSRCIFCHAAFPANEALERFPRGARIAFDPGRGRLWAVCGSCSRWTLAPIEERWEALEEIEKLTTDRGRLLSSTDNIALIRAGQLDFVRVGKARLVEEAWWRYGRELQQRLKTYKAVRVVETGVGVAVALSIGWWFAIFGGDRSALNDGRRWLRYGSIAWRGASACNDCGAPLQELAFKHTSSLVLYAHDQTGPVLRRRCRRCALGHHEITGASAQHTLRRILAWQHFAGASERRVRLATDRIDAVGSPEEMVAVVSGRRPMLKELRAKHARTDAIALEIALNDAVERVLLEIELRDLEDRWRAEEELAAIVDGELTPLPPFEQLRRRILGQHERE